MSDLSDALVAEHQAIAALAQRIRTLPAHSEQTVRLTVELRDCLLAHLEREEREFYPAFERAAATDARAARVFEAFGSGHDQLVRTVRRFFEIWLDADFPKTFEAFAELLRERIAAEDRVLFLVHERLVQGGDRWATAELIANLRQEHEELLELVGRIGVCQSGSAEYRRMMQALREKARAHLQREDEQFYAALSEAAQGSTRLRRVLDAFAPDHQRLTEIVLGFLEWWCAADAPKTIAELAEVLRQRVDDEERVLFPFFKHAVAGAGGSPA